MTDLKIIFLHFFLIQTTTKISEQRVLFHLKIIFEVLCKIGVKKDEIILRTKKCYLFLVLKCGSILIYLVFFLGFYCVSKKKKKTVQTKKTIIFIT